VLDVSPGGRRNLRASELPCRSRRCRHAELLDSLSDLEGAVDSERVCHLPGTLLERGVIERPHDYVPELVRRDVLANSNPRATSDYASSVVGLVAAIRDT
jgi:hypothetical protein